MEQMKALIMSAIKEMKVLELTYKGHRRVVEPHAYGRDQDGDEIIRCYQVAGGSASGETTGWKVLKLSLIASLRITEKNFLIRSDYRRNDSRMILIFCQV